MTTDEFGNLYLNNDFVDIFEETCEFFSEDLPEEFIEEYDMFEVLVETKAEQEKAKNIDNVLRFTAIIREKQPDLYLEFFEFFDDFLVNYYSYLGDKEMLREAFAHFQAHPLHSLDDYLVAFIKLVYYQHTDIIQDAVSENFDEINEYHDSFGNPEYELASIVYGQTLEKFYLENSKGFNRNEFYNILSGFNFDFKDEYLDTIDKGLFNPCIDTVELKELFQYDERSARHLFELYFYRHMYDNGFKFYLSSNIWEHMSFYWKWDSTHNSNSWGGNFAGSYTGLEEFVFEQISHSWFDKTAEMISVIWGSVYVYEFLYEWGFINKEAFIDFLRISRKMKGRMIGEYSTSLWNANFVHQWEKPECVPETEFREEEKIFRKSLYFTNEDSNNFLELIKDELSLIGPLAHEIKKNVEANEDRRKKSHQKLSGDAYPHGLPGDKPFMKSGRKVGRNEPCPCGSGKKYKKCCGRKN